MIGPVALIGVSDMGMQTLQRLGSGILWDKTYVDVLNTKQPHVEITVRSLTTGEIGLDWGTQSMSTSGHVDYSQSSNLHNTALTLPLCESRSAGFPGGFVMTRPLCARVTVSAGKLQQSSQVSFGAALCPS